MVPHNEYYPRFFTQIDIKREDTTLADLTIVLWDSKLTFSSTDSNAEPYEQCEKSFHNNCYKHLEPIKKTACAIPFVLLFM